MQKLALGFISFFLLIISTSSFATPVRHHFTGVVEGSSFGYEGKTVTGWYEYDFDTLIPDDAPHIIGLFSYVLDVGGLEIASGTGYSIESDISFFNGATHGFWTRSESPHDLSGFDYALDVFEMSFSDGLQGTPENYIPSADSLNFSGMKTGGFEILGHAPALLPDQSYDVFWLKGTLQQVGATHTVPEPSLALLFALGLLFAMGRRTRLIQ